MKSTGFKSIKSFQKINHFPGSFQLGRKDRLWRNVSKLQAKYGKKEFNFLPQTFVLPWDKKLLRNCWDENQTKNNKYIIKPPAAARGIGIRVISKWKEIPTKRPVIVQKYLSKPYLINGHKFDLRLYVYVTSFDPLIIYLYEDGLVRFASHKFSSAMKSLSNKYMHLTNYSINKKSGAYRANEDASKMQGHKWTLSSFWTYLASRGENVNKLKEQIKDAIIKSLISVEQYTNVLIKSCCRDKSVCHEVFGFDVMLDDKLKPWVLEANISPSLHSNSSLDIEVKGGMIKDLLNLAGFKVPNKGYGLGDIIQNDLEKISSLQDRKRQSKFLTNDSKSKHVYFQINYKSLCEAQLSNLMLSKLTQDDVKIICDTEDEFSRRGNFTRIFPSCKKKYLRFFETPRYYNLLMHFWEIKYSKDRVKGIEILNKFLRNDRSITTNNLKVIDWSIYTGENRDEQQTFVQMLSISRKKEKEFKESKSHSTKSNSVLSKVIKSTPTLYSKKYKRK